MLDRRFENALPAKTVGDAFLRRRFYRIERGADVGDLYMTLISTAQLHHENPFDYLVALLG